MNKPILVVTSRYPQEVEDRIDRDYNARRNPNQSPFSQQKLLSAAEGADAMFITPADRLDSGFFQKSFVHRKNCRDVLSGFRAYRSGSRRSQENFGRLYPWCQQ